MQRTWVRILRHRTVSCLLFGRKWQRNRTQSNFWHLAIPNCWKKHARSFYGWRVRARYWTRNIKWQWWLILTGNLTIWNTDRPARTMQNYLKLYLLNKAPYTKYFLFPLVTKEAVLNTQFFKVRVVQKHLSDLVYRVVSSKTRLSPKFILKSRIIKCYSICLDFEAKNRVKKSYYSILL